jgi:excisionase family DNA binding protein
MNEPLRLHRSGWYNTRGQSALLATPNGDTDLTPNLEINANTYYTPDEAAGMLRVSKSSLKQLLESGAARGVKIGRSWRVLGRDLLDLTIPTQSSRIELTHGLMRLSESAFEKVWDNDEDSIYDHL